MTTRELKFLSEMGKRTEPSFIKTLVKYMNMPGMVSLGGGIPSPLLNPIVDISFTLQDGTKVVLDSSTYRNNVCYANPLGRLEFHAWVKDFVIDQFLPNEKQHKDAIWKQYELCITNGSQDGIQRALEMILDNDDTILVEEYTYSGTIAALKPIGCKLHGLPIDQNGLIPSVLESILHSWNESQGKFPKALYIIPTGQNPTGTTLPAERKRQIYEIACKYDILILEDDAYWFLQIPEIGEQNIEPKETFLGLDVTASIANPEHFRRVLRFDSLSKVFSTGYRIGWTIAPKFILDRICWHLESGAQSANVLAQLVVYNALITMGPSGWDKHINTIHESYRRRRDKLLKAFETHLSGLAKWNPPKAGLFVWVEILNVKDTRELVSTLATDYNVLLVPGAAFYCKDGIPSSFVRMAFSYAAEENLEVAVSKLGQLLRARASQNDGQ